MPGAAAAATPCQGVVGAHCSAKHRLHARSKVALWRGGFFGTGLHQKNISGNFGRWYSRPGYCFAGLTQASDSRPLRQYLRRNTKMSCPLLKARPTVVGCTQKRPLRHAHLYSTLRSVRQAQMLRVHAKGENQRKVEEISAFDQMGLEAAVPREQRPSNELQQLKTDGLYSWVGGNARPTIARAASSRGSTDVCTLHAAHDLHTPMYTERVVCLLFNNSKQGSW